MELNVFVKYKVKRVNTYSYISDRIGDEFIFGEDTDVTEQILSGSKLLGWIIADMSEWLTINVNISDNNIFIEQFNPTTGEGADIEYIIEKLCNK